MQRSKLIDGNGLVSLADGSTKMTGASSIAQQLVKSPTHKLTRSCFTDATTIRVGRRKELRPWHWNNLPNAEPLPSTIFAARNALLAVCSCPDHTIQEIYHVQA